MKKETILAKCLDKIKAHKEATLLVNRFEDKHLLIFIGANIEDHIQLTTKQALRLIPFSYEKALVPTLGWRYFFKL